MTLGDILRNQGGAFLQQFPQPPGVQRVLRNLAACRTEAMGGHVTTCCHCQDIAYHYHSCGDRYCPQCGGSKRAAWLERQAACLLDVPYFHVVFTLPHQLSPLVLGNRQRLYHLLFSAASKTLLELAADEKYLGAKIGALMVLHTWGQQLEHHPHVHCVIPNGGLSAEGQWRMGSRKFFLPVRVLAKLFRGKFLDELRQCHDTGQLQFAGSTGEMNDPAKWKRLIADLYKIRWVTYAKEPFGGPEQVLKYLAGYTHRVALSNPRILKVSDSHVTLSYKDYADGCRRKELVLPTPEFLRRFSLHIQTSRFVRIRQFGLLSYRNREGRLTHCRELIAKQNPITPDAQRKTARLVYLVLLLATAGANRNSQEHDKKIDNRLTQCDRCGGPLEIRWSADRPTSRALERSWQWNTS